MDSQIDRRAGRRHLPDQRVRARECREEEEKKELTVIGKHHLQEFVRPLEGVGVEVAGEGLALVCPPRVGFRYAVQVRRRAPVKRALHEVRTTAEVRGREEIGERTLVTVMRK